jgi:hypothetical protein
MVFPLSQSERSPLARLVLFVICLSVAGMIGAGALSVTGTLAQQQNPQTPINSGVSLTTASTMNERPCPYDDLKTAQVECKKACTMPNGLLDLYCYEYCIDEVCYHH